MAAEVADGHHMRSMAHALLMILDVFDVRLTILHWIVRRRFSCVIRALVGVVDRVRREYFRLMVGLTTPAKTILRRIASASDVYVFAFSVNVGRSDDANKGIARLTTGRTTDAALTDNLLLCPRGMNRAIVHDCASLTAVGCAGLKPCFFARSIYQSNAFA